METAVALGVGSVVRGARSLDDAMERLVRLLGRSVRLSRVSVRILDAETDELVIVAAWSPWGTVLKPGEEDGGSHHCLA